MFSIVEVIRDSIVIAGFVFVMMVVIEYLNVWTRGAWQRRLGERRWGQYLLAALLGATPGCLGAYVVVAMFSRGAVTMGAVVAAMAATCGDEAFLILARVPLPQALTLIGALAVLGVLTGAATDLVLGRRFITRADICEEGAVHDDLEECRHFSGKRIFAQWRSCSPARGFLTVALVLFLFALLAGLISHEHAAHGIADAGRGEGEWDWIRATMTLAGLLGLFIVATVPDHFLEEHLWNHIAKRHVWKIFCWTFLALGVTGLIVHKLESGVGVETLLRESQWRWVALFSACLMGLIPTSGPHMVFVLLFADGVAPLSVLVANSIVQDGHGMLPLLAHSKRSFFAVKGIKFFVGLAVGAIIMVLGW